MGIDVGRRDCSTEIAVIRVVPQPQGTSIKSLVNLISIEGEHFENQAIKIKKIFFRYKARMCVIDANGVGIGLADMLIKPQIDPDTGEVLPPLGVEGGAGFAEATLREYKKIKSPDMVNNSLFLMKANLQINNDCYVCLKNQLVNRKLKLLINERIAKEKLLSTKVGQTMTPEERNAYLMPYQQTSIFIDQTLNMKESNEDIGGVGNIRLEQINKTIHHDKFSAVIYGLYYVMLNDKSRKRKRNYDISDLLFFN